MTAVTDLREAQELLRKSLGLIESADGQLDYDADAPVDVEQPGDYLTDAARCLNSARSDLTRAIKAARQEVVA